MSKISPIEFSQLGSLSHGADDWYFFIIFQNENGKRKKAVCLVTYEWLHQMPEAREYGGIPEKWRENLIKKISSGDHGFTFEAPIFVQATTIQGKIAYEDKLRNKFYS